MKKIGKYEVLGELGRGAFGIVYRARDQVINRTVALKTMSAFVADNPALMQRFYREAQSAGSLQHPNIVTIYDLGEEDGSPYIAMELVDGQNLDDLIGHRPPISISLKVMYAVQACRAFDYAHKRGIIHRDIKPANVMVTRDGVVKVVDFGIARVLENSKTQTGMLIGTFSYMAPEVFQGEHANARSDVWSCGVLFYELLAYRRPFQGESPAALMKNVCMQDPLPLRQLVPDCPEDLESVIHRMLLKPESDRYQSMEEVLGDLEPIAQRLRTHTVEDFVQQSRKAFEKREFEQARNLLQQAILVDSTNQQARALFEKVNLELRKIASRPEVEEHVARARSLLQEGKLHEANVEVGTARSIDSSFAAAKELQRELQEEVARVRQVNDWLQLLKQHLIEGLPEEAEALLAKVQQADPNNPQLPALQEQVADERARRQKRLELSTGMQQARTLWSQRQYKQCIDLLTRLQKDYPHEAAIGNLLETAREDEAEQHRLEKLALARNLLAARNYDPCIAVLTDLQQQSPADEEVRRLLITARADQAEHYKAEKLAEARRLLAAAAFDECIALLEKLKAEFAGDSEVDKLLQTTRDQKIVHHKREQLTRCRKLLSARQYEECIAVLVDLLIEFPQDEEIRQTLDTARDDCVQFERRQRLEQARALVATQQFADAMKVLDPIYKSDPNDSSVVKMRALVLREQESQARTQNLQREWDGLKKLVSERAWADAVAKGEALLQQFPGEHDLTRLVEFARKQQVQTDQESRLRANIDEVHMLMANGRFSQACETARTALQAYPDSSELISLLRQSEAREKKEQVRQLIEQRVREIRFKINAGQLSEAKNLAEETLETMGPDTDVQQLLTSVTVEFQARKKRRIQDKRLDQIRTLINSGKLEEAATTLNTVMVDGSFHALDPRLYQMANEIEAMRKGAEATAAISPPPAQEYVVEGPPPQAAAASGQQSVPVADIGGTVVTPGTAMSMAGASAWQSVLPVVERQLAQYVGPMARVLVKKAAAKTADPDELYRMLAANLERETDREAFLAHRAHLGRLFATVAPGPALGSEPSVVAAPGAGKPMDFRPEELERAARLLARHIGPISRVLVKKAAASAHSVPALYHSLADHVQSKADREKFLHDAGFPEKH